MALHAYSQTVPLCLNIRLALFHILGAYIINSARCILGAHIKLQVRKLSEIILIILWNGQTIHQRALFQIK